MPTEFLRSILNHPVMPEDLTEGLGLLTSASAREELDTMVARVEGRFERSRNFAVVCQFIQDHSRLKTSEVIRLFEFIYSSLVNKFKGELAEVFARRVLAAFRALSGGPVPLDAEILLGKELAARQLGQRGGWYAGADALFCRRDGESIEVIAIAEIKSKGTPLHELQEQVVQNLLRMRRGLRVAGAVIDPRRIHVRTSDGARHPVLDVDAAIAARVPALMIVPRRREKYGVPVAHPTVPNVWTADLPYGQDEITEAAYRFMSWYFGRVGPKVFRYRAEPVSAGDTRRPAAHADLSLEKNGEHAFLEAMYYTALRPGLGRTDVPVRGKRTPWETLLWLYNSLGFGYDEASTEKVMFPEFEPTDALKARVEQYQAAVAAYRQGSFRRALEALPDPETQHDRWWRRREWLMAARIHARLGDVESARDAIEQERALPPIETLSLPIERAGVGVLVALQEGGAALDAAVTAGIAALAEVRDVVAEHEFNGWELPGDIEPNSAREGVIDIAIGCAALGRAADAVTLVSRLRGLKGWEYAYLRSDEHLARAIPASEVALLEERNRHVSGISIF
jgi:hypothetical protein